LEALDRTMKDLRNDQNRFGGAMILLAGDFRQTLPLIPRSTPVDELNACLTFDRTKSVGVTNLYIKMNPYFLWSRHHA
jgi:PIF1 helicase.